MSGGPWEDYAAPAAPAPSAPGADGPWADYAAPQAATQAAPPPQRTFTLSNLAKGLYNSVESAVTLPGQVWRGEVDPMSEEALSRVGDLAGLATPLAPGRLAAQAERSAIFSDPRRLAGRTPEAAPAPSILPPAPTSADVLTAAGNVGIDVPRVALMGDRAQKIGAGLSDLPLLGAPLQRQVERTRGQIEDRVASLAAEQGNVSRETAGGGLQEGIQAFKQTGIPAIEREAYRPVNEGISATAGFAPVNTAETLVQINQRLRDSGGKLTGEAARVADLVKRGELNFQAIQDVRSALGKQMNDPLNRAGYDDFADSALYASLSRDMEEAARTAGGEALEGQLRSANAVTREAYDQFGAVKRLAGDTTSPNQAFEQAYALAMDRRGSLGKLYQIKKSVPKEAWGDFSATAIDRMGRNNNEQFSAQVFVSSYDKMAPSARTMLFGEASKSVDDLATTLRALQNIERFKSKSQSANVTSVAGLTGGAATGLYAAPVSTVIGGLTAYAGASWLAKPQTVQALAKWTKSYEVLVRRPSRGLAEQANSQAKRLGGILVENGTAPAAANDATQAMIDAARSIYQGSTRGAADSDEQGSRQSGN